MASVGAIEDVDRPPSSKSKRKPRKEQTKQESLGGAIVRSLFGTLAFLFKRPVRLFRPVKLSSWTILEAMAKREGRSGLSLRYISSLLRREHSSFLPHLLLPPLLFNTAIGFTLFEAYSITESHLLSKSDKHKQKQWTPLWIVTVSGAVAGAAQCFLSAPLDNVRYVMQQNVGPHSKRRHHSPSSRQRITNISWRAILRAAVLPFAPAIARDKLVQAVHTETIRKSSPQQQRFGMSAEKRQEWEKRLKRWRGGIHGSGLALSLIRDSVGFGSFFCIFEASRRCAYYASTTIDQLSAWINGRGVGIVVQNPSHQDDVHIDDVGKWVKQDEADVSYNTSRTVQGRVVAVIILLIGGAIGALSYELVGRPFELMRVVIWQGRKQWEQGKREPKPAPIKKKPKHLTPKRIGIQHHARSAALLKKAKHPPLSRLRHRSRALHTPSFANLQSSASEKTKTKPKKPASQGRKHQHTASPLHKNRAPTLATRPGFLTLLIEHAQSTSRLDRKYGAPQMSSKPLLLLHTYFIAPFLPEIPRPILDNQTVRGAAGVNSQLHTTQASKAMPTFTTVAQKTLHMSLASRRRAIAESPEDKVKRTWIRNNPVNRSLAHAPTAGTSDASALQRGSRYWASGRVTWALKRLATPYGVAFLVFAWLGGDLSS